MNIYPLAKPLLFQFDAESTHDFTLKSLKLAEKTGLLSICPVPPACQPRQVMGITFPNPVGLAAGLDKNGAVIDGLAALGFGFIEVGTVTPRPQPGNPKPRLFRVKEAQGIVNRFGFNNLGVDNLIENVKAAKYKGVLGINIGKNFDTPIENAVDDYLICMRKVYEYASYITVNISSPNTKNLRALQEKEALSHLLATLKLEQTNLANQHAKYVPIALKIAPDLECEQVSEIADLLMEHKIDGVIATNTTLSREMVLGMKNADETGGLSGAPVRVKSTLVIQQLSQRLQSALPIIGVGGILSSADAVEKIAAGADLVQVYSGLIYKGPKLVHDICRTLG
ncbi:quinone-dependent dihydroorotate dehydrogenase [Methylotenera sp.]|uniref:quinone-dependent dihydroorotate dehydrogenase n=1 Tax=Methylotenera sp. TaxID=2051956 RepID=UPI002719EE13|nr:quinone-dependent dihydroorotate dehydrogenase [Methylotenera sp.]MDO9205250.1 quinone-dependent dihydroorotate dehydrogenase [Methylotenera sp.]MDP1521754.1 quinone-dependent dihydroorotate dehydrogenase [Methylotenera sp.]MDP2231352.1 quinone-dependent dihydroorotate dehydrogenase [Methylotenera sp.]MDP3141933.1 quinone-dependent dihydroorotate dehydrogenase [Methylotenera sp.]MDP3306949.1 quinone-dependent dihydroorotate dehydrogenase [Methylotenera sp.]